MLLGRAAHGLAEAERHEIRLELRQDAFAAAPCRHKDHARAVEQRGKGVVEAGELAAGHRMSADVVHACVERGLLEMLDHELLDADHIDDHAALFHFRHIFKQPVHGCLRIKADNDKIDLAEQCVGRDGVDRAVSESLFCGRAGAVPAENAAERARLDGFRHRAAHQTESGNEYGIKHEWVPPVANFIQIKCITARRLCQGGLFRRQALEHAVVQAIRVAVLAALLEGEFVIKALRAQVFFGHMSAQPGLSE